MNTLQETALRIQNLATEAQFRVLTRVHGEGSFALYQPVKPDGKRTPCGKKTLLDLRTPYPSRRYPKV